MQAAAAELGTRIEVRPQAVTIDGTSKRVYWEDLTNISDESFFIISGSRGTSTTSYFTLTVPVSLLKGAQINDEIQDDVRVENNNFRVLQCITLTCNLYVIK